MHGGHPKDWLLWLFTFTEHNNITVGYLVELVIISDRGPCDLARLCTCSFGESHPRTTFILVILQSEVVAGHLPSLHQKRYKKSDTSACIPLTEAFPGV